MTVQTPTHPAAGLTERFDPTECLDEHMRLKARPPADREPGRYLEVQGPEQTLLIPLEGEPIHIGRGLAAELHLDEKSVSRRHAILVPSAKGAQILDDRSANGTIVNGRRVQQAQLSNGDVIALGRVMLRYLEL
jgi:pSer/pThr/pTyr-binding forkhead associated (FHA) protein